MNKRLPITLQAAIRNIMGTEAITPNVEKKKLKPRSDVSMFKRQKSNDKRGKNSCGNVDEVFVRTVLNICCKYLYTFFLISNKVKLTLPESAIKLKVTFKLCNIFKIVYY